MGPHHTRGAPSSHPPWDPPRKVWGHNNSVHHNFQRCLTIHGTHGLTLAHNVAYETMGHCYFVEDGVERSNVIHRNLGLVTRPGIAPYTIPSDDNPATFWITSPLNTVTANHAAGSANMGIWYTFGYFTSLTSLHLPPQASGGPGEYEHPCGRMYRYIFGEDVTGLSAQVEPRLSHPMGPLPHPGEPPPSHPWDPLPRLSLRSGETYGTPLCAPHSSHTPHGTPPTSRAFARGGLWDPPQVEPSLWGGPLFQPGEAFRTAISPMQDNTAHSNGDTGFMFGQELSLQQDNIEQTPSKCDPRADSRDPSSPPAMHQISGLTVYKNAKENIWSDCRSTKWMGLQSSEGTAMIFEGGRWRKG